jgi:hypothetical protein
MEKDEVMRLDLLKFLPSWPASQEDWQMLLAIYFQPIDLAATFMLQKIKSKQ